LLNGFANAMHQLESETVEKCSESPEIKLILAGDGSLLEEMKELTEELEIEEQVLFPGYITNIQELYSCCQAAVTTSKIEGLPFHVMEALCCNLPVIASNIKGHQELISHRENGLLFDSEDEAQLADRLIELFRNNELRDKCKAVAAEKMKPFSIESVLPAIMGIYRENIASMEESKHDNE
jgi:glycosyltransferase EpsD